MVLWTDSVVFKLSEALQLRESLWNTIYHRVQAYKNKNKKKSEYDDDDDD